MPGTMLSAAMRVSGFGTNVPDAKPRRRAAVLRRGLGLFGLSTEPATEHLMPAKRERYQRL